MYKLQGVQSVGGCAPFMERIPWWRVPTSRDIVFVENRPAVANSPTEPPQEEGDDRIPAAMPPSNNRPAQRLELVVVMTDFRKWDKFDADAAEEEVERKV